MTEDGSDTILGWCPTCEVEKTLEQLIAVPRDDNGNVSFFGCRECNGRTYGHKDAVPSVPLRLITDKIG